MSEIGVCALWQTPPTVPYLETAPTHVTQRKHLIRPFASSMTVSGKPRSWPSLRGNSEMVTNGFAKLPEFIRTWHLTYQSIIPANLSWPYNSVKVQDLRQDSAILYATTRMLGGQDGVRFGKERDSLQKCVNIRPPVIVWHDFIIDNHFYIYTASIWVCNLYGNAYFGACCAVTLMKL